MPPLNTFSKTCVALAVSQLLSLPLQAATITVNSSLDDDGAGCTLREAVLSINSAEGLNGCLPTGILPDSNTINFNLSAGNQTITLIGGQLTIGMGKSVTINGTGETSLTIDGSGANGAPLYKADRVFNLDASALNLNDLTITGGSARGPVGSSESSGGGIQAVNGSTLSLTNSTVSGNYSNTNGEGGGIFANNNSSVRLTNSTVTGNSASGGGGIYAEDGVDLHLTNSTVSENMARSYGGGIVTTRGFDNGNTSSTVTLLNSTISGNSAGGRGGGIYGRNSIISLTNSYVYGNAGVNGGGISTLGSVPFQTLGRVTLIDSTVSGNFAREGGGIYARDSSANLMNSTVSGNSAYTGGGIYVYNAGKVSLTNSTVSGNSATGNPPRGAGGGIFARTESSVSLTNSTVSGNSAVTYGGGIKARSTTVFDLINTTVSENSAGVRYGGVDAAMNFSLTNSIVSGNLADSTAEINFFTSGGVNLLGHNGLTSVAAFGDFFLESNDIKATSDNNNGGIHKPTALRSILKPLKDNGGSTQTHALSSASPAIDAGSNAACAAEPVNGLDQRVEERDDKCDIGSYEYFDDGSLFVIPIKNGKAVIFGL